MSQTSPTPSMIATFSSVASLQNIWNALSQDDLLSQWYGPPNSQIHIASMDFQDHGSTLLSMTMSNGHSLWEKWTYTLITPHSSLSFDSMLTDEKGLNPIKTAPMPAELSSVITLSTRHTQTQIHLESHVKNPTPESLEFFSQNLEPMTQAWLSAFQKLDRLAGSAS